MEIVWSCHCSQFFALKPMGHGRQVGVVNIVTSTWTGHSWFQILAGPRDYYCCQSVQNSFGAHPVYYSMGVGLFPGGSIAGGVVLRMSAAI